VADTLSLMDELHDFNAFYVPAVFCAIGRLPSHEQKGRRIQRIEQNALGNSLLDAGNTMYASGVTPF